MSLTSFFPNTDTSATTEFLWPNHQEQPGDLCEGTKILHKGHKSTSLRRLRGDQE